MSGPTRSSPPSAGTGGGGTGQVTTGTTPPTTVNAGDVFVLLNLGGGAVGIYTAPGGLAGQIVIAPAAPGASIPANELYIQTDPVTGGPKTLYAGAAN
jgi:hypothetical protein